MRRLRRAPHTPAGPPCRSGESFPRESGYQDNHDGGHERCPQGGQHPHHQDQSMTAQSFSTTSATPKAPHAPIPRLGELDLSGMGISSFVVEASLATPPGEAMSATGRSCSCFLSGARTTGRPGEGLKGRCSDQLKMWTFQLAFVVCMPWKDLASCGPALGRGPCGPRLWSASALLGVQHPSVRSLRPGRHEGPKCPGALTGRRAWGRGGRRLAIRLLPLVQSVQCGVEMSGD
jgi:hypothetical protein